MNVFVTILFWIVSVLLVLEVQPKAGRIIGGDAAYAGQYPHAAAINVQTSNSRFFCGGTLIGNEWIATAGQCVNGGTLFTIDLGSSNLKDDSSIVTVATSEYVLHPDYNPLTLENDIGLIKLHMPVEYSLYLNKVNLLGSHYVVAGSILTAIGWGQTSDDSSEFSSDLMRVNVVALSNEECRLTYGNQINDNTICIDGSYNEGSCYGDTGSALIQTAGMGYQMLVGISSFHSSNGCESTDPSGYVRFYPYRDWITSVTGL